MSIDLEAASLELEDRYPSDSLVALCAQRCSSGASFRRVVSSQLPQHVLRKPLPFPGARLDIRLHFGRIPKLGSVFYNRLRFLQLPSITPPYLHPDRTAAGWRDHLLEQLLELDLSATVALITRLLSDLVVPVDHHCRVAKAPSRGQAFGDETSAPHSLASRHLHSSGILTRDCGYTYPVSFVRDCSSYPERGLKAAGNYRTLVRSFQLPQEHGSPGR
jgi:hypothetical protein